MSFAPLRSLLVFNAEAHAYARALRSHCPGLQVRAATERAEALPLLAEAEALAATNAWVDDGLLAAAPALRWVHALTSGTEAITGSPSLRPGTVVTSSRGAHGPQMSELALLLMLALARDLPRMLRCQREGEWQRWPQPLLWQRHAVLVGTGHVARELARRCRAMGMRVSGISARPSPLDDFDAVHPRERLAEAVSQADFVVVLTALDAGTRHLIDAGVLAAMPARAFLVNLSRGGVVDETALVDVLARGAIAGAGLDVFEVEPLAPGHALRQLPNVIVTPHVGGLSDVYVQQVLPMLLANAQALMAGKVEALVNRVR